MPIRIPTVHARRIWLHAQKLDEDAPFGNGPEATRAAVRAWGADGKGPQLYGQTPDRLSDSVTTVMMPEGVSSDPMRKIAVDRYNLSLGGGLGPLMGKVFRIGHLGDLNEPMLLGCLATTELAMKTAGIPFAPGGVDAAIQSLAS